MRNIAALKSVIVFAALVLCGCGGSGDQPELGLVSGTVRFEGTPLPGAVVTFMPEAGRPASGVTDMRGVYELTYIRDTKGCKIGPARVSIAANAEGGDEMELEGDDVDQSQHTINADGIPARYNDETELTADVKPGENTFDFDLEKETKRVSKRF
ncbi:hypothetical protein [Rubinisphaera margarita]|uniref:hypothetical protein n=1 Tax=Rubinisphaera margarita TaxID=2909586 RepID=UPI001EE86F98|nr:hypothetical protein [Rubinisphaera margarita]MCG6157522.1 hypothetical protein [Rubinisphaera margarita]